MTIRTDESTYVEADADLADKWRALQQLRTERDKILAAIDRAEAFFSALFKQRQAQGFTVDGVEMMRYTKNATFRARQFADDNPHHAKECMVTKEVVDPQRVKALFPGVYEEYVGYKLTYPTTKSAKGRR